MNEKNEIKPKETNSNIERQLLSFIAEEATRIGYGKIMFEITVHKGKLTNIQATEVRRSFNLNS